MLECRDPIESAKEIYLSILSQCLSTLFSLNAYPLNSIVMFLVIVNNNICLHHRIYNTCHCYVASFINKIKLHVNNDMLGIIPFQLHMKTL